MDRQLIYLDHAAATPMDRRVLDEMTPYFSEKFFNPSSPYLPAVEVRRDFNQAKHKIASLIGGKTDEIIITAGATESINIAFNVDGHVVVPNIEHAAVIESAKKHDHTFVKSDKFGRVVASDIKNAIKPETVLVSVALANNELGTIQPIREIAEIIKQVRQDRLDAGSNQPIYFHCDASQGVGQLDVNVARLGVDMLTINAGKIYGPKQVGLLWITPHVKLNPLIVGGGQELGIRSGTENVAGVIGFSKALELAYQHRKYESERLLKLRDYLENSLISQFSNAVISGHPKHRLNSYLHISFPGLDGERLIFLLEKQGVMVATGSACAANKGTRSHVLTAIGLEPKVADGSIRLTLGQLTTEENVKLAAKILIEVINDEYQRVENV